MSDSEIRNLWSDPSFEGSFSGVLSFQQELKNRDIFVSTKRLTSILSQIPQYLRHIRRPVHFPRRPYFVHGWWDTVQMDTASMKNHNGYIGFICLVDLYTLFICTQLISDRKISTVKAFLKSVFEKFGSPSKLECDKAGEYAGCISFFKEKHVYLHFKRGKNKANYSESAINLIKRRLFMMMHDSDNDDWPKMLPIATKVLNSKKHPSLGGLRPIDLTDRVSATKVDLAIGLKDEGSMAEHRKNEEHFLRTSDILVGDYVLVIPKKQLRTGDVQVIN